MIYKEIVLYWCARKVKKATPSGVAFLIIWARTFDQGIMRPFLQSRRRQCARLRFYSVDTGLFGEAEAANAKCLDRIYGLY